MKEITKKIYYCEHCNKHGLNKGSMSKHEKWCYNNPENYRVCRDEGGCKWLQETEVAYTVNEGTKAEYERKSKAYRCTKLDKILYPLIVERKGLNTRYSVFDNQEPMPKECGDFVGMYSEIFNEPIF